MASVLEVIASKLTATHQRRAIESLETRELMAADVWVQSNTLHVKADDLGSEITVRQSGDQ